MPSINAGQLQTIQLQKTQSIFVTCTGNANISYTDELFAAPGLVSSTSGEVRVGPFAIDTAVTISVVSGVASYQSTPTVTQPLQAVASGGAYDSTPVDVAQTVNQLVNPKTQLAKNLPYTQFIPSNAFSYSIIAGSPTITVGVAPNGMTGLKVTASAYTALNLTSFAGVQYSGDMYVSLYGSQSLTNLGTVELLAVYGTPAANYRRGRRTILEAATVVNDSREQGGAVTYHFNDGNTTTVGTIPTPTSFEMSQLRLQLNPAVAGDFTVWIFAVGLAKQRKGRICVMYDDGYASSWKLGHPVWKNLGIPQTMAVIATETGKNSTYMSVDDLKAWNGAGNSCVAHGPNGGTGSLITRYGTDADFPARALADIKDNVDFIRNNGLAAGDDLACYVYPQGEFQRFANDTALLDGMIEQGLINVARSATIMPLSQRQYIYNQDPLSGYQRLAMPRIGHKWAGTTALEATNITNIVSYIQQCALYGLDFFLVFHQVKPSATPDNEMGEIDIRVSDMQTLANAVKTEIDAGRLEAVHMRDFVAYKTVYQDY